MAVSRTLYALSTTGARMDYQLIFSTDLRVNVSNDPNACLYDIIDHARAIKDDSKENHLRSR